MSEFSRYSELPRNVRDVVFRHLSSRDRHSLLQATRAETEADITRRFAQLSTGKTKKITIKGDEALWFMAKANGDHSELSHIWGRLETQDDAIIELKVPYYVDVDLVHAVETIGIGRIRSIDVTDSTQESIFDFYGKGLLEYGTVMRGYWDPEKLWWDMTNQVQYTGYIPHNWTTERKLYDDGVLKSVVKTIITDKYIAEGIWSWSETMNVAEGVVEDRFYFTASVELKPTEEAVPSLYEDRLILPNSTEDQVRTDGIKWTIGPHENFVYNGMIDTGHYNNATRDLRHNIVNLIKMYDPEGLLDKIADFFVPLKVPYRNSTIPALRWALWTKWTGVLRYRFLVFCSFGEFLDIVEGLRHDTFDHFLTEDVFNPLAGVLSHDWVSFTMRANRGLYYYLMRWIVNTDENTLMHDTYEFILSTSPEYIPNQFRGTYHTHQRFDGTLKSFKLALLRCSRELDVDPGLVFRKGLNYHNILERLNAV